MEKKVPYLCGGVLLFLLSNFTPNTGKHTNPVLMADLVKAIINKKIQQQGRTIETRTSACINCNSEKALYIPTVHTSLVKTFVKGIIEKETHRENCVRMYHFTKEHIDEDEAVRFVKSLLYIIENDSEINDNQLFYINNEHTPITKTSLKKTTSFTLPSFLVGIMYFILEEREEKNCDGLATLEFLGTQKGNKRILENDIANKITREISVNCKEHSAPKSITDIPDNTKDLKLLEKFKHDYDSILMKCIETNFGEPFEADLIRVIQQLRSDCWNQRSSEFENPKFREIAIEIVNTLFQLSNHLSNDFYFSDILDTTSTESPQRRRSCYDWHSIKTSFLYIAQTQQRLKQLYKELYHES